MRPEFFDGSDPRLAELRQSGAVLREHSILNECFEEYFEITHPTLKPGMPGFNEALTRFVDDLNMNRSHNGHWVFYPWSGLLLEVPKMEMYRSLHTSRNRNLVREEEQAILFQKKIGIAGMSVGSNVLNTMVLAGVGGGFSIADPDVLSLPNLNRLMASASAIGMNKAEYFAQKSYEVDPYLNIAVYKDGISTNDCEAFLTNPSVDILVEEMDNPVTKVKIREAAKHHRIPVVMAADNGDGVLIDVERYDENPDLSLFNGRLDHLPLADLSEDMNFPQKLAIIAAMAGLSEATPRMQDSILDVGKTLNTWPQLGTAALVAGVALTFIVRRILLGEPMPSGRYYLTLEDALVPGYLEEGAIQERAEHRDHILQVFRERYGIQ